MDSARELELDASDKILLVEHRISPFVNQMLAPDATAPTAPHESEGDEEAMQEGGGSSGQAAAAMEAAESTDTEGGLPC